VLEKLEAIDGAVRLQVIARDAGEGGPEPASVERARAVDEALRARGRFVPGARAERDERVACVVVAEGEPMLVGTRVHRWGSGAPGERPAIDVPPDAPSRAYAKLEEALAWSGLEVREGERAVEIGSAPGGAAYALARRGVHVLGVDPGDMDPRVLAYVGPGGARVTHLRLAAGALRREHVPKGTSLVLSDVNLAPPVALRYVASLVSFARPSLRAAVLTMKLNDRRMVEAIPTFLERVREMGLEPRATQLPSNRREICIVARRRRT
jgi:23S rRNA (cytidine2498-2'-O)-methyltransferase